MGSTDRISVFTLQTCHVFCSANTITSLPHLQCAHTHTHTHTCLEPLPFPATTHTTQMSLTLNSWPIIHLQGLTVNRLGRFHAVIMYVLVRSLSVPSGLNSNQCSGQKEKQFFVSVNLLFEITTDKRSVVKDLLMLSVP